MTIGDKAVRGLLFALIIGFFTWAGLEVIALMSEGSKPVDMQYIFGSVVGIFIGRITAP